MMALTAVRERRLLGSISDAFFACPELLTLLLLLPPLLWIGISILARPSRSCCRAFIRSMISPAYRPRVHALDV